MHQGSLGISGMCFVLPDFAFDKLQLRIFNPIERLIDPSQPLISLLQACEERIKSDKTGEAHCTGQVSKRHRPAKVHFVYLYLTVNQ